MRYWGKLVGFLLGIISGVGLFGTLCAVLIGHWFDQRAAHRLGPRVDNAYRQNQFFITTFEVMGHVAKAKGRVTQNDIQLANRIMDQMRLTDDARLQAQQAFRQGKAENYPLKQKLSALRVMYPRRFDLAQVFLEVQLQAALIDQQLHPQQQAILLMIAQQLGIASWQFERFLQMIKGGFQFNPEGGSDQQQHRYQTGQTQQPTLQDACRVLGVNQQDDGRTIKRAYRKLMVEHHPDKLMAKGLPPQMMEVAKQKAQDIQAAYDLLKVAKGFK